MPDKRDLTLEEMAIFLSEMRHAGKSLGLAYLMLIGGHLGLHRFYLRKNGTAIVQLVLFLAATIFYLLFFIYVDTGLSGEDEAFDATAWTLLGLMLAFGLPLIVWILVDLFLLPRMVREWNERAEREIVEAIVRSRHYAG